MSEEELVRLFQLAYEKLTPTDQERSALQMYLVKYEQSRQSPSRRDSAN